MFGIGFRVHVLPDEGLGKAEREQKGEKDRESDRKPGGGSITLIRHHGTSRTGSAFRCAAGESRVNPEYIRGYPLAGSRARGRSS